MRERLLSAKVERRRSLSRVPLFRLWSMMENKVSANAEQYPVTVEKRT